MITNTTRRFATFFVALVAALAVSGAVVAPAASAHSGAWGVVAVHGGGGWADYQEIVFGKSQTHWLSKAPVHHVGRYLAEQVLIRSKAPRWLNVGAATAAVAYGASTKIRLMEAEREGVCFSMVKIPYTYTYWPAKTRWGCR